jgi:hypothetical protein
MIFSPIQLNPANQAIDRTVDNIFFWQNRGSIQTDFQILALRNSDNAVLYDSTKITSSDNSHTVPALTFDLSEQIKWQVVVWNGLQTASSQYAFITADEPPTLVFTAPDFTSPPVVLGSQNYLFQADYNQSQDISISQYRFILYDMDDNVVSDTGFIYGFTPEYQATGMIREEFYQIEGQAIAQNGLQCTTGKQEFSIIAYDIPETVPAIEVTANNCNASITVDWADLKIVTADIVGTYSFIPGKFDFGLLLDSGSTATYNESVLGATNNISGWFKFPYEVDGDFITFGASGVSIGFDYDTQRFYINNNGNFTYSPQWGMYTWADFDGTNWEDWTGDWRNPGFNPVELTNHWFWFSVNNTNQLVAYFDDQFVFNITDNEIVGNFDSITLTGQVLLDNIHAQNTSLTLAQIQSILLTIPQVWQINTNWLANYENNLEAGNIYNNVPVVGWVLKRRKIQDDLFTTLGTFDKDVRTYIDYTAVNNETYIYSIYSLSSEGEGLGLEGQATMSFFGWFLVATDGSDEFLKFDSGLKDGIKTDLIKVNKDFYQYNNFTQYPTISYGKQNYKSSKIECLPFLYINNTIVNDINLLNTCDSFINDMKIKILKNSKGEIFFVNTKNFDYKYLDESSEQPFSIVFEWVEVASSV